MNTHCPLRPVRHPPFPVVPVSSPKAASPTAIIGAGAVGQALARGLNASGGAVEAVLSRTADEARRLADRVGAPVGASSWEALPATVRRVLVCVPDDAIVDVAGALARCAHPWDETLVAHTSGAKTAAALSALAREGAATMSFHPMQTFAPGASPDVFEGIVVGLEGDEQAVAVGEAMAQALGARPLRLTPEEKVRVHCAAALASNGLVALMGVVEEVFGGADSISGSTSIAEAVAPLVEQTWSNLTEDAPEDVLTGPVARGDEETVQAHLDALHAETPHLVPLYTALSTEMVRVAVRGGQLETTSAASLLKRLRTAADAVLEEGVLPNPLR